MAAEINIFKDKSTKYLEFLVPTLTKGGSGGRIVCCPMKSLKDCGGGQVCHLQYVASRTALWAVFIPVSQEREEHRWTDMGWRGVKQASLEVVPTTSTPVPLTEMQSHGPANCKGGCKMESSSRPMEKRKSLLHGLKLRLINKYTNINLK